jgi:signal transduction histidine kinase
MDAGLLKIEKSKLIALPFPDPQLFTLTNWKDSSLWISGIHGIYHYFDTIVRPFYLQNGFPIKEYNQNSFYQDSTGFLYFGGIDGVQKFHPNKMGFTPSSPVVLLKRNRERITVDNPVVLAFDQSEIILDIQVISISDQNLYKVEIGYGDDWSELYKGKQINFEIPYGDSFVQVRISDLINNKTNVKDYLIKRALPFWKNPWYILLIIFVFVLLIIGGISLIAFIKAKRQNKLSNIRIEEQQKGLIAVIQAQEDERKRIAKDLHDGIVQQLTGLKLGMQKIFNKKESDESNKLITILDNSAKELRELSHRMMPRSLGELGLLPSLEEMLENSIGNTSIHYQFENFGIKQRFDENIEIAIYRIAQELINNVIKHSKASNVNIQLFMAGNEIVLIIEDNGIGMDLTTKKDGIGLMNISSRLDTINGKVNFEPSPESGTLATVKIPLND